MIRNFLLSVLKRSVYLKKIMKIYQINLHIYMYKRKQLKIIFILNEMLFVLLNRRSASVFIARSYCMICIQQYNLKKKHDFALYKAPSSEQN